MGGIGGERRPFKTRSQSRAAAPSHRTFIPLHCPGVCTSKPLLVTPHPYKGSFPSGQPRRWGVNRDEREHRPRQGSPRWCSHSRWVSWRTGGGTWNPPASGTTFRGTDPPGSRGERGRLQGQGSDAQDCCGVPAGQGDLPPTPLTQVMGFLPSLHDLGEILRGHALAGVQASGQVSQAGHQLVQG